MVCIGYHVYGFVGRMVSRVYDCLDKYIIVTNL